MKISTRKPAIDCYYFKEDRPCVWHKTEGFICECKFYTPLTGQILIIKLDAMGDVLRTTCMLPELSRKYSDKGITWVTRTESVPLLFQNKYLHRVIPYSTDAIAELSTCSFDIIYNLDAGRVSCTLATMAQSPQKVGFMLDGMGRIMPTNPYALHWLKLGVFNDLKRANKKTYQEVMADIAELDASNFSYVLNISEDERNQAFEHLKSQGYRDDCYTIGLNIGAGGRWQLKQWRIEGFIALINKIYETYGNTVQIVLLGGKSEHERNAAIRQKVKVQVIDPGCDNEIRHFAAIVGHCSVVVAGDTLAMHIGIALECRTIVLFGPTSNTEIELYGSGEKVIPNMDCLCCYKTTCDFTPNCMDLIKVDEVFQAIQRQLALVKERASE